MVKPSLQRERIVPRLIEQEMRDSFIDYSMSVIVQRALPDARDGLKPVHRRILYAMHELGLRPDRPHKKSATVVGDVLGKYHPHGDSAVYDTIVRMVQDFSLRYPLLDGQGNFGSVDGDSPAAYRYTEVRLAQIAVELLFEIELDTVEWRPNFDGRLEEPVVLPTRLPHLLVNGADGIAVGMATKIPPHNLRELLGAVDHLIQHPDCEVSELAELVPGPDFPTGGYIWGHDGIRDAYETGRGLVEMRARLHVEEGGYGKRRLVVTELPYQVNKTRVIEQITRMAQRGRSDAITDLRDESDRDGIRLVVELKRDADPKALIQTLFKKTQLRTTYGVIMLALRDGRPVELDLKQALECFVEHRLDVIRRRASFELDRSEERAHVVEGLLAALDEIDRVVAIIRGSRTPKSAAGKLRKELKLSARQAEAILAMRLSRLTGLEHRKLADELGTLRKTIEELRKLVTDEEQRRRHLRSELRELSSKFGDSRRTEILDGDAFPLPAGGSGGAILVLLSRLGLLKALPARPGAGMSGAEALEGRAGDFAKRAFLCRGSDQLLAITAAGNAHAISVSELPVGTRSSRGRRLSDFIELEPDDRTVAVLPVDRWEDRFLITVTRQGQVKRTPLTEYANARAAGIIGMGLAAGDEVVAAAITDGAAELLLSTRRGQAIRFSEDEIRPMGRAAKGVRGISLATGDLVAAGAVPRRDRDLLFVTGAGFAKRVPLTEFRLQSRAGKGVDALPDREKTGDLVSMVELWGDDRVICELSSGDLVPISPDRLRARPRRSAATRVLEGKGEETAIRDVHHVGSAKRTSEAQEAGGELAAADRLPTPQGELELVDR